MKSSCLCSCHLWPLFHVAKVFSASFWMMLLGHPSSKPTTCWSNIPEISMLDLGKLSRSEKESRTSLQTTRPFTAFNGFDIRFNYRACHSFIPNRPKDAMWIRRVWRGFVAHLDCRKVRPLVSKWPSQTLFHLNYSLVHYNLICHSDTWLQGISAGLRSQDAGSSGIPPGQGWG